MTGRASGGADPGAQSGWRWDVALSFAGAQRAYVEQVAAALKARGVRCFYDANEEIDLWGKYLAEELPAIYSEHAAAVVVFVSADYVDRDWTRVERRAALDRAVRERREYVLPVRIDDTALPGLLSGLVAVDVRGHGPLEFAGMVATKLARLKITGRAAESAETSGAAGPVDHWAPSSVEREPQLQELYATLHTSLGDVELRLFPEQAPTTVRNFVGLAEGSKEWWDPSGGQRSGVPLFSGTIFYRYIPEVVIPDSVFRPGYRSKDEFHLDLAFTRRYLLAIANAGPGTKGSQFFITLKETLVVNRKDTIFGEVVRGQDVVDRMATVQKERENLAHQLDELERIERVRMEAGHSAGTPTPNTPYPAEPSPAAGPTGRGDRPKQDVVLNSVTIERWSG